MNFWLKTLLIMLAGAVGGLFGVGLYLATLYFLFVFTPFVAFAGVGIIILDVGWPFFGFIGAAKASTWAGNYLDNLD